MTIYQEVKLDSDKLFQDMLDSIGEENFTEGIIKLCCNRTDGDFDFENGLIAALQKFIKENESPPESQP